MTLLLFKKTDFEGDRYRVTQSEEDLSSTPVKNSTSSAKLTQKDDKVLFFKKKNYKGNCMFRKGEIEISKISSNDCGGKNGFGNTISSARLRPFTIKIYAIVICNENEQLPGDISSKNEARGFVDDVVKKASKIWEPYFLNLELGAIDFKESAAYYDINGAELSVAGSPLTQWIKNWDKSKHATVFIVNSIKKAIGRGLYPCWGDGMAIEATLTTKKAGNTLAHELGHYLGLGHVDDKINLMHAEEKDPTELKISQVEEVHKLLAKNISRKGLRIE